MLRRPADRDHAEYAVLDAIVGGTWRDRYPSLWLFLSCPHYEDLETRQTGTLLIFVEQGRIKACLSDRECQEVAFVTAGNPDELFVRLEEGLKGNDLDWRPARRSDKKFR